MLVWAALDALFPSTCGGCNLPGAAFCAGCRLSCQAAIVRNEAGLRLIAGGVYAGALRRAILAYKCGRRDVGKALAVWLTERCPAIDGNAVLVPVPTTRARRGERGFDQSVLLARELGARWNRPVILALEHRTGDAQRGRSRAVRLAARNRFACVAPALVAGVTVVLVDDVVTTGATLADSARILRDAGAHVAGAVVLASAQRVPSAVHGSAAATAVHR